MDLDHFLANTSPGQYVQDFSKGCNFSYHIKKIEAEITYAISFSEK
jgi:hypothetical protein